MERRCLLAAAQARTPAALDDGILAAHRRRLLHRAEGRVLDLSARWEPNLLAYRRGRLTSLTTVAPPGRRRQGTPAGVPSPTSVASARDAPSAAFDAVVLAFTLCAADDPVAALAAAARHLAPGGHLLVLEHVRGTGVTGVVQHVAGPLEWRLGAGCRFDLDVAAAARRAGLALTDCARFRVWVAAAVPTPCVAAVVRPATTATGGTR